MKFYSKFLAIALVSGAVACSSAPEEAIDAKDAEKEAAPVATAANYALDTEGDEIVWIGFKTYADDTHTGTLQIEEGEFQVEGGNIVSGNFVINMNSINNTDMPADSEYKTKLEGHLKSDGFFAVEQYPTATFALTGAAALEGDTTGATHMLSGNLTMRDQTKNISFAATVTMGDDAISISAAEFVIDRTQWGVQYNSTASLEEVAKENAIDDNIKLTVNFTAKKS